MAPDACPPDARPEIAILKDGFKNPSKNVYFKLSSAVVVISILRIEMTNTKYYL